jgi:putative hydrolase of the HAD superfamily
MSKLTTIAFDADDTLWHNERHFKFTQAMFVELLGGHAEPDHISERLQAAERKNLKFYGFGIKGFTLSMIETAIEVTGGKVDTKTIAKLLEQGREMLQHPVELLPHARETLQTLHKDYKLLLITKGDLFDQERKVAASGLGEYFDGVEIVSDKTPEVYAKIFKHHGTGSENGMMAGNSLKSDVIPMLTAGGFGVHVPHELTWEYENVAAPIGHARFYEVKNLNEVVTLLGVLQFQSMQH